MVTAISRHQRVEKTRLIIGKGFEGSETKVICLESLIRKLNVIRTKNPTSFSVNEQDKVLTACREKISKGERFVKVKIIDGSELSSYPENKKLLRFELTDDFSIPEKIRMFCSDVFKELPDVGIPALA